MLDVNLCHSTRRGALTLLACSCLASARAANSSDYFANTSQAGINLDLGALRAGVVSVLNYGVDPTGKTDCSAGVQAAVAAAPAGGTVIFPPGRTYLFVMRVIGFQIIVDKPLTIIAIGAHFDLRATVRPRTWSEEQHNAIFRILRVDGFTWNGGSVDGHRDDPIPPWVSFITGHGCRNASVSNISFVNLDHNEGSVRFDSLLPDNSTQAAQQNINISYLSHRRCYYGPYVIGSIEGLNIHHIWGIDFDLQDPQNGFARGYAADPLQKHFSAAIGVYGFDGTFRTSKAGKQRGVKISDCYFNVCTQGPVAFNFVSKTYKASSTYDCIDIEIHGNTIHNAMTGIHVNGWEQAAVNGNVVSRLTADSTALSSISAVSRIASTTGLSGAMIEISTSGRKLSACNNNLLSRWPDESGAIDLSGGCTGINIGATSATSDTATTAIVDANIIDGFYIGVFGTGTVMAQITNNRFSRCRHFFENLEKPLNGGNWPEGVFSGNTIKLDGYAGTKIGGIFRGRWDITDNKFYGNLASQYSYIVQLLPGNEAVSFSRNRLDNASQGLYIGLADSVVTIEGNDFSSIAYPLELVKNKGSTVRVVRNLFAGSTTVNMFTGRGTHGNYYGEGNTVLVGGWTNDSAANFPTDIGFRAAAPSSGTWTVGCRAYASNPTGSGYIGWICVGGGSPGIWRAFGQIVN